MEIKTVRAITRVKMGNRRIDFLIVNEGESYEIVGLDPFYGIFSLAQCETFAEARFEFEHNVDILRKSEQNKARQS